MVCCNDGTKKMNCPERRRDFRQPVSVTTIKDYDKVENITWYKPQAYPYYANSRSYVLPYIGVGSYGNAWLRLVSTILAIVGFSLRKLRYQWTDRIM